MKFGMCRWAKGWESKKILFLMFVFIFSLLTDIRLYAQEIVQFSVSKKEVVFLVDASKSMVGRGDNAIMDFVRQILYSLPSDVRAGLVVYNTEIQDIAEVGSPPEKIERILGAAEYVGYSNAGQGLKQSISLFSDEKDVERHVILVSDGEIDMRSTEETEASREEFVQCARQAADKAIKIHIVAVEGIPDVEKEILKAAEISGGNIYIEGTDREIYIEETDGNTYMEGTGNGIYAEGLGGSLPQIAWDILWRQFNFPRKSIGIIEGSGGTFHIEIPQGGVSKVKVLLAGGSEMENVEARYTAGSGRVTTGNQFAVAALTNPKESIDITFSLTEPSTVEAWLVMEYQAVLDVGVEYRTEIMQEEKTEPIYRHYMDMEIKLAGGNNGNINVWRQGNYEGHMAAYTVNGEEYEGEIKSGVISHTMPADGLDMVEVDVGMDSFYEIYGEVDPVQIKVELPPAPVQEVDYRPLWYILGGLAAALVLILAVWMGKRKTALVYVQHTDLGKQPEKYEVKSCQYTGKLNLYVVQTPNDRDIAPQTIRLFGRKSGRMTLEWMLNSCGIKLGNVGAEDIVFYPGPEKTIVVMDQSEQCTVMRGMEILKKGIGYPVNYNEKITATMEDGVTELEIHYKNLKPSEQQAP